MANNQLPNDVIRTFPNALGSLDNAGNIVPNPGATFTATVDPANVLNVVVNGTDVVMNAIGPNTTGIQVTFSESGGVPEAALIMFWDIVDDLTPASVGFNTSVQFTDASQPVPSQTPATP